MNGWTWTSTALSISLFIILIYPRDRKVAAVLNKGLSSLMSSMSTVVGAKARPLEN